MKRTIFTILILVLSAFVSHADTVTNLIITHQAGNTTVLPLETQPVLQFEGENMVVSSSQITITIPIADIVDYRFVESSGIKEKTISPVFSDGHVIFQGLPPSSQAYIYSLGGEMVMKEQVDSQGVVDFNLRSLPAGTYIITTKTNSLKILKNSL
jgi:hypothetical protein